MSEIPLPVARTIIPVRDLSTGEIRAWEVGTALYSKLEPFFKQGATLAIGDASKAIREAAEATGGTIVVTAQKPAHLKGKLVGRALRNPAEGKSPLIYDFHTDGNNILKAHSAARQEIYKQEYRLQPVEVSKEEMAESMAALKKLAPDPKHMLWGEPGTGKSQTAKYLKLDEGKSTTIRILGDFPKFHVHKTNKPMTPASVEPKHESCHSSCHICKHFGTHPENGILIADEAHFPTPATTAPHIWVPKLSREEMLRRELAEIEARMAEIQAELGFSGPVVNVKKKRVFGSMDD